MIESRDGARLPFDACEAIRVGSRVSGERLDRDLAAQASVAGAIDLAYSSGPKGAEDFVDAEAGS